MCHLSIVLLSYRGREFFFFFEGLSKTGVTERNVHGRRFPGPEGRFSVVSRVDACMKLLERGMPVVVLVDCRDVVLTASGFCFRCVSPLLSE